ncbi:MAG: metal-dependent transcriptional regulator [ANME-2 cluster archaeon]|nr:metal-dependent transcriptional regulator [ANME-2 cluster archaeon]
MKLSEPAEEILEKLWICTKEEDNESVTLETLELNNDASQLQELLKLDYVNLTASGVSLTEKSYDDARNVVRRHRLAERLLTDVLNTKEACVHRSACEFEHILHRGIDENVCTLLGHPRSCPHGKPIPEGECCRKARTETQRVVAPLSSMKQDQHGKIAYLEMKDPEKLQTLIAMGMLPGMPVMLIQTYPSYIFQVKETQYTVDEEIAGSIYVRLNS